MLFFSLSHRDAMLESAKDLTASTGWKADAVTLAAFSTAEDAASGESPVCVGVFQGRDASTAEFHCGMAPGHLMSREIIRAMAVYAFSEAGLGLEILFTSVAESNKRAQIVDLKVGFEFEHRKRYGAGPGEDAIVFSMRRENIARFLPAAARPTDRN